MVGIIIWGKNATMISVSLSAKMSVDIARVIKAIWNQFNKDSEIGEYLKDCEFIRSAVVIFSEIVDTTRSVVINPN